MEMSQQVVILIILLGIGTQYYLSNKVDFQHFKRKVFKRCETLLLEWQTWLDRISSADFNENTEVTQDKTKDNFVEPDRPLTEEGYYGTSPEPRLVHPNKVTYRVGQIVRCKRNNAAGVIVGWDETPKAPEASKADDDDSPHYLVLIDTIEANTIYDQLLYLPEEELIIEERLHKRITNLGVSKYFETYQNGRYLMRPWLQEIYPRD